MDIVVGELSEGLALKVGCECAYFCGNGIQYGGFATSVASDKDCYILVFGEVQRLFSFSEQAIVS